MEHPEERYYKLNRFYLVLSGLWPYQSARDAFIMRTFITVIMISTLFVQVSSYLVSEFTINYLIELIPPLFTTAGALIHLYMRLIHMDKFKELFDRIWDDWALQKTEDEMKIMHKYTGTSRSLSIFCILQIYGNMLLYVIILYSPDILDVISPMNQSRPRNNYFIGHYYVPEEQYISVIRMHTILVLFSTPIVYIACLHLFIVVAQHACGMCELLGFVNIIEHLHTLPFLMDLLGIIIILSLTLTQIVSTSGSTEKAIRSTMFANIQITYIALCNYLGQQIMDNSAKICDKVYNSAWYYAVVEQQKSLLLIMRRRVQPLVLTACKFYVMSLPSLGKILHTAITYCMYIRQI